MRRPDVPVLVAAVVAIAGATALGSSAEVPGIPAIYVDYNADCTIDMKVDGVGSIMPAATPGPTLPPGTYQLLIWMPNPNQGYVCGKPTFTFTGPGVNSVSEFKGQELEDDRVVILLPSSTYIALDANVPGTTRRVFTTAAYGSSSALLGPTAGTTTASKPSVQPDLVGSAILQYQGELVATVSAAGKATLKLSGRSVSSLKAGKYDIKVDDADRRAGFFVQRSGRKAVTITGLAFAGERTQRVALTAGTWTFFSKVGKPTRFTVVA
jgi:hypothetical protein